MRKAPETYEQQMKDSERICKTIKASGYKTFAEVENAIVLLWLPDMSFSRAGISHALKELKNCYP